MQPSPPVIRSPMPHENRGVQRRQEPRRPGSERGPVPGAARTAAMRSSTVPRTITGHLYDGKRGGWHASRIAMHAVAELMLGPTNPGLAPGTRLIEHISAALRVAYARHGILDVARSDHALRFGATLTLAVDLGEIFRFVPHRRQRLADQRRGNLHQRAWRSISSPRACVSRATASWTRRVVRAEDRARVGRAVRLLRGGERSTRTCSRGWTRRSARCCMSAVSRGARARLPAVPEADIRHLLDTGISGQSRFANNTISPLELHRARRLRRSARTVQMFDRPRASVHSIELFTDGYFRARRAYRR